MDPQINSRLFRYMRAVAIVVLSVGVCSILLLLHKWKVERANIIAICQRTKWIHSETEWAMVLKKSRSPFQSPTKLKNFIVALDHQALDTVLVKTHSALLVHAEELAKAKSNPLFGNRNTLEMTFHTGYYEGCVIQQQVLWSEISSLIAWQPSLSPEKVADMTKSFDHDGLKAYTEKLTGPIPQC